MALRIRRGTEPQRTGVTLEMGEIVWTTDAKQLWVGDGLQPGGYPVVGANVAGFGLAFNASSKRLEVAGLTTNDIPEGTNNKYFSTDLAQDAAALLFSTGSHTGITFQYDDTLGKINAVVTSEVTEDNIWSMFRDGTHSNIAFTYTDNGNNAGVINATVTLDGVGIANVQADTTPTLGGNLGLNAHNITGSGNIDITGTLKASFGLGGDLDLNSYDIIGTGNIITTGDITLNGEFTLTTSHTGIGYNTAVGGEVLYIRGQTDGTTTNLHVVGFNFSKGTVTSPLDTVAGDFLGGFAIKGYRSTDPDLYTGAVAFIGNWDASANFTGDAPASGLTILTGGNGTQNQYNFDHTGKFSSATVAVGSGTAANPSILFRSDIGVDSGLFHAGDGTVCVAIDSNEKARFDSGGLRVNGFMKVSDVAGTLPNPPEAGMIVLDGGTFKGYNGSAWVTLG